MLVRRLSVVAAATAAAVAFSTVPAEAHFCFKREMNEHSYAGKAGSNSWVTFEVMAAEITGLCTAGLEILADAGGVEMGTLIKTHGVMAGPTDGNKAIGHLDFDAIDAAFPAAAAACAP